MKIVKHILRSSVFLLVCFVMLLCTVLISCDESDTNISCNGISLDRTNIYLTVGDSTTLIATVIPENSTDKKITWTSSDEKVALVTDGQVEAVGKGVAVIIATTSNGITATCTVTVAVEPDGVSLSEVKLDLTEGDTATLTATVSPSDATNKSVTWKSSNIKVASVNDGKVTAVGVGSATITVTTSNGKRASCTVNVNSAGIEADSVSLNKTKLNLTEGDSATLTATVSPSDATNKNVTWKSSNTKVATVSDGKVKAVGVGSATITVTTSNGKEATCTVTVKAAVLPTGVSLNKTTLSMKEGNSYTLKATVSPSNATNKNVTWKSSNTKVATVSDGKVKAVGAGSATITVTTSNGKTATCTVSVTATIKVTDITLNRTNLYLITGDVVTLSATVSPSDAEDKSVTWKSSNTKVATVSDGKVKAVGAGSATITVTSSNGKKATCSVTVTSDPLGDFYYKANTTGYTITGVKSKDKTAYIVPSNVTEINDEVFAGCNNMESLTLPGDINKRIGALFGKLYDPKATATKQSGATYYIPNSLKTVTLTASIVSSTVGSSLFNGYSGYISVNIESSVTSIGSSAFSGCSSLTSIVIPDSVTSIGSSAFSGCSSLTSIEIPDSVTSIGDWAFEGCNSLTSITIPNSVTSIGKRAFECCNSLMSIVIPDSVTSVGSYAFRFCSSLKSIVIPDSVTWIGEGAFSACTSLESITLPFVGGRRNETTASASTLFGYIFGNYDYSGAVKTLQRYYKGAWSSECCYYYIPTSLKSVTITGGNILSGAFYNCDNLTSIVILDSVTSINGYAFYGCSSLTSITIGNSVTSISWYVFSGCSSLTSVYITDIEAWCNIDFYDFYSNPLCNGADLYLNNTLVTDLVIPDSVTSIGDYTFRGCSSLTSITIGNSVTNIGNYAFYDCVSLTSVTVESGNTKYHSDGNCLIETDSKTLVFGCKNSIIPDDGSVTSISSYAFRGCSKLTSIVIPDSVTSIGVGAFSGCISLESITLPFVGSSSTATTASSSTVFGYIFGSSSYTGGTSTEQYYSSSYSSTYYVPTSLKSVTITGGNILYGAFYGCSSLTSIEIPDSVTRIGVSAFCGCSSLTSIEIPDSVTRVDEWTFLGCRSLTSIVIPDSVTRIGSFAFEACSSLTSINIPDSVTRIGSFAFRSCRNLTSVTIPDSVTSIGDSAFYGCSSLTSIKYRGTSSQWTEIDKGDDWNKNTGSYEIIYNYTGE